MKEKLSRRSFVKKAGALAALTTPFFITKDLFANGSPNEKLNIGVIGLGMQVGGNLMGTVSDSRCMLHSICDVDTERLDLWKDRIEKDYAGRGISHTVKTFKDFREMLKELDGGKVNDRVGCVDQFFGDAVGEKGLPYPGVAV